MATVHETRGAISLVGPASAAREDEGIAVSAPGSGEIDVAAPEPDLPTIHPLTVRTLGFRDLMGLRRLDPLYRLNQPDLQLDGYRLPRAGVSATVPGWRGRRPAFVALAGDRLVGFVQFQTGYPDQRWMLLAVGASVGVFEADPVWEALLAHGVRAAGLRGVKRLYARVPRGLPIMSAFRRGGWSPYTVETVYAAHNLVIPRARATPAAGSE